MLLIGPSRIAPRRRRGAAAFLSLATPVSPQPPGAPLVVSGTYGGAPAGIRVAWRQDGSEVGPAVTAGVVAGGAWSATITTPVTTGVYTLHAAFEGGGPEAQSGPVTISASGADVVANFTFEGSGLTAANAVALFGHGFAPGDIPAGAPVVLRNASDGTTLYRTQMNVLSTWGDGSAKTALLAGELPALADGATLGVQLVRGASHPSPGPALSFGTALSGRTAAIKTWAPGNTTTPLWTFNPLAAIGADRWHNGPLALSTRVEAAVPSSAVLSTSDSAGVIESVRLVVDVIVTKDGFLELDVCFSNDRLPFRGSTADPIPTCGIARFGYTIEIDGEVVYDQRPATGAGRDLLQWSQWIRRRGRKADGTRLDHWGTSHRAFFRPDHALLVRARLMLPYDTQQVPSNASVLSAYNDGAIRQNDPYWSWGLARQADMTGGRPEIGYRTEAAATWIAWPTREAQIVTHRQFEAAATRPMYYRDWPLAKWASHEDYPRLALPGGSENSAAGTLRPDANGLPSNQQPTHNTTDHITIDTAHHGSFNWTPALLSGRRVCYDSLAARVFWSATGHRYNGTDNPYGTTWRSTTRDVVTGIRAGGHPWMVQTRSEGWNLRDHVDALGIWPDAVPQKAFANEVLVAHINAWKHASETWMTTRFPLAVQEVLGLPIMHAGIYNCERPYMTSFFMYAVFQMLRLGLGGPHLPGLAAKWFRARTGWYAEPTLNHRAFLQDGGMAWGETANGPFPTDWAGMVPMLQVTIPGQVGVTDVPPDWVGFGALGDYNRNRLNNLAMIAYGLEPDAAAQIPIDIRARAADGLALLRSERYNPTGNGPRIGSTAFGTFFNTCAICPVGNTWRTESAPAIVPGQTFQVAGDAANGTIVGLVRFTGAFPRNSTPGRGVANAWEIVSQPAGNPLSVSEGGVLRVANAAALGTGSFSVSLRCRTYHQDNVGDPSVEHVSGVQAVTVEPVFIAPSLGAAGPFSIGSNTVQGRVIATLAVSGTEPITLSIVAGDPNGLFMVDTPSREFRVAASSLTPYENQTFNVTVRAQGPLAYAERTYTVEITEPVYVPVWNPNPQARTISDLSPAGTDLAALTLDGSPPTTLTILAGNTNNTFQAVVPNIIRAATRVERADAASYSLTVRAENSAGSADGTVNVTVQPRSYVWNLTDSNVIAAYSASRRVRSGYVGPLFRLIRLSDNAERDVGFDSGTGLIDETGLAAWIGNGQAEVILWYDQSPLGQHLVPVSASLRPVFADAAGTIYRMGANSRPAFRFEAGRGFVQESFTTLGTNRFGFFTYYRRLGASGSANGRLYSLRASATSAEQDVATGVYVTLLSDGNLRMRYMGSNHDATGWVATNNNAFAATTLTNLAGVGRRIVQNTSTNAANSNTSGPFADPSHLRVGTNTSDGSDQNFNGLMGEIAFLEYLEFATDIPAARTSLTGHYG